MTDQPEFAAIEWRDGTNPIARQFDDPYFSLDDGLAETNHVFLRGNDLPNRFCTNFHIGELGFGTGLNMLTVWDAWIKSGTAGPLLFTSFEAFPMRACDMRNALTCWPELSDLANVLLSHMDANQFHIETPTLNARIILGDARATLPLWGGQVDAWFLDGFSPAKNPELWQADLMQQVGAHTRKNGSFATYTAAGHVRNSLTNAGFDVERIEGFGRKRHMNVGVLRNVKHDTE